MGSRKLIILVAALALATSCAGGKPQISKADLYQEVDCSRVHDPERRAACQHYDDGGVLYKQARYQEAYDAFARAHGTIPHYSNYKAMAECSVQLGRIEEALRLYVLLLETDDLPADRRRIACDRVAQITSYWAATRGSASLDLRALGCP